MSTSPRQCKYAMGSMLRVRNPSNGRYGRIGKLIEFQSTARWPYVLLFEDNITVGFGELDIESAILPRPAHRVAPEEEIPEGPLESAFLSVKEAAQRGTHMRLMKRLSQLSIPEMTSHLHKEVAELSDALILNEGDPIGELADVLCIAFHFAVRQGWTPEEIESAIYRKLLLRIRLD